MEKTMFLTFLFIVSLHCQSPCKTYNFLDQVQIGSFKLSSSGTNNLEYTNFTKFTPTGSSKLQMAMSLTYIEKYNPSSLGEIYFRLASSIFSSHTNKFMISFWISKEAEWTQAHVSYLATSNSLLHAGIFSVVGNMQNLGLLQNEQGRFQKILITSDTSVHPTLLNLRGHVVHLFLSGIKTKDTNTSIKISGAVDRPFFSNNKITAIFLISEGKRPFIEILEFTYFIYSSFSSITTEDVPNSALNVRQFLKCMPERNADGKFFGLTEVKSKRDPEGKRRMLNINNFDDLEKFKTTFEIKGLIIDSQVGIAFVSTNKLFTPVPADLNNQQGLCPQESEGIILNSIPQCRKKDQRCDANDYFYNNQCHKFTLKTFSICNNTSSSQYCQCPPQEIKYSRNGLINCITKCPNNQFFNHSTQQCDCLIGNKSKVSGECIVCEGNFKKWNDTIQGCECVDGSSFHRGRCTFCHLEATYEPENQQCRCRSGFIGNGIVCRKEREAVEPRIKIRIVQKMNR